MRPSLTLALVLTSCLAFGHGLHDHHLPLREFHLKGHRHVHGSFLISKGDSVYLETGNGAVQAFTLDQFEEADRQFLLERMAAVERINRQPTAASIPAPATADRSWMGWVFLLSVLVTVPILVRRKRHLPLAVLLVGAAVLAGFRSGVVGKLFGTDPVFLDAAFTPFKPHVITHWDNNWFYVESNGLPTTHSMMTGIVKWQQQVPIPQCYIGANAWQIPLNPELAAQPVPVNDQHFLRGAIALATNGIPIFNPHTNTGVDALQDGQLDQWGGHSGRADDYHYHIAPLFLDTQSAAILPIAFGLDGFAVYAGKEPDGTPMAPLDSNHGHFGTDGVYHYHGTPEAPYMIGNMVGKVTEDATLQIIPQPKAQPVRPSLTPLNGATITGFEPNGTGNGYHLTYTRNGNIYKVHYDWTSAGTYTYQFIAPTDTVTEVYNGPKPCQTLSDVDDPNPGTMDLSVFPNPSSGHIRVKLQGMASRPADQLSILDLNGRTVFRRDRPDTLTEIVDLPNGVYLVKVSFGRSSVTRKIVVQ